MTTGECAYWACALEATAAKPGNVHPRQSFPNLTYSELIESAKAIAPVLDFAAGKPVGKTVLACIRATRAVVNTNANLGIVLLLAPLAAGDDIATTLKCLSVADAIDVYAAIRLAEPGGLGRVVQQDVTEIPTVTLREAMAMAADRDSIARQYVNDFSDVLAGGDYLVEWQVANNAMPLAEGIVSLHLWFLARMPDSLVARKRGLAEATELQQLAEAVRADSNQLGRLDEWFAAAWPHRNPGTTADLVGASLFAALRQRKITLPAPAEWPEIYR